MHPSEMTEVQFQDWRQRRAERRAALIVKHQERLRLAFAAGQEVVEHCAWGDERWPRLEDGRPVRDGIHNSPETLAEHLKNRHLGFGYDNTIEGVRFHLGRPCGP